MSDTAPTYPSYVPVKKLDYIFASSPWPIDLLSTDAVNNVPSASDHRPVLSTIRLSIAKSGE